MKSTAWKSLLIFALSLGLSTGVFSQTYPSRPITLVAPSSPGSAPDVLSRFVAQKLSELLGQPVAVLNRPGAGGNIGSEYVVNAQPDGYTVLLGSIANTLNPHIMKKVGFRLDDLAPVSSVAAAPDLLVVVPSMPVESVADLIAYLKAHPGTPVGHSGVGTTPHLSIEMFRLMTGVQLTLIPFKGGGAAQQGILSGQVPFMFSTTIGILPRVRSGQLRALAVSSGKRIAAAPQLPTVAEAGVPGFDVTAWFGLFVPAKTPKAVIERLSQATRQALSEAGLRKKLIDLGAEPLGSSPEEFAAYVHAEYAKWGKLVKEAGIHIE